MLCISFFYFKVEFYKVVKLKTRFLLLNVHILYYVKALFEHDCAIVFPLIIVKHFCWQHYLLLNVSAHCKHNIKIIVRNYFNPQ